MPHRASIPYLFVTLLLSPLTVHGQDASSILEVMRQKQIDRAEGVDAYIVVRQVASQRLTEYHKRFDVDDGKGNTYPMFQSVRMPDVQCLTEEQAALMMPEGLETYAGALESTGDVLGGEVENGLAEAGLPRDLFNTLGAGGDPWATTDVRRMYGGMATFARGAADAQRQNASESEATPDGSEFLDFAEDAKLVGTEKIDGNAAFHLRAEGLKQVQEADGQTFTIEAMSFWIDSADYVPLRTKVEGTASDGRETRPLTIEKLDTDYRNVPDSNLYESFKQSMRIGGMMDAAQEAQMKEAQQKMAEFEQQMAEMPASQRQMMERMMGPQLETMRQMVKGGAFETETTIEEIKVVPLLEEVDCVDGKAG